VTLRYALLAMLTAGPMTGYEISRRFQSTVGHLWHAPDSQIYPELRKMEDDALVEAGEEVGGGPRGIKRRYEITDAGIRALREWMETTPRYAPDRDPAHLRAAYFEWASDDGARRSLEAHIAHFTGLVTQWERQIYEIDERINDVLVRRLAHVAGDDQARVAAFKRFSYEGLIARAETEIAWAERGLRLIDRYAEARGGAGA
jgi:PadR family transcriptional regulator, regulatory protein AphA